MSRVFIVATSEFLALVRTKGFLIGLLMAPLLLALSVGFQVFAARSGDTAARRFVVIDHTGVLYDAIATAAAEHNVKAASGDVFRDPAFLPEPGDADVGSSGNMALSERVRQKDIFAFVDIPESVLDPARTEADQVNYYTETPSYTPLPQWLNSTLDREITARRFRTVAVEPAVVTRLTRPTKLTTLSLFEQRADGSVAAGRRVSQLQTFALPFGLMYLLFLSLMTAAPQLLTAVVEEKMSRISEVLIAAISPVQLMAGKLLGVSAVAALLALVYLTGGLIAAANAGAWDLIRVSLIGWFLVYLVCAVLIFGSVFLAIGSACSDLKDAQAYLQYLMMFLMLPLLATPSVLRSPDSTLSIALSLFPTATPFLMLVRLALTPPPPAWQVIASVVLTSGTAALLAWVAGRIFRVGLLMQGKPPNLPELLRWIRQ